MDSVSNSPDMIDFNSQAISEKTLVSTFDDPGKYDVELGEEGQEVKPADIPLVPVPAIPDSLQRHKRTKMTNRYYTLAQAWGPTQIAWQDDERIAMVLTSGANGFHFSDNLHNLNTAGIASGVGIGHIFPNQVVRLDGYTGPLWIYADQDATPISVTTITVEK